MKELRDGIAEKLCTSFCNGKQISICSTAKSACPEIKEIFTLIENHIKSKQWDICEVCRGEEC